MQPTLISHVVKLSFRMATAADVPALVDLIDVAFRSPDAGWTSEAAIFDGSRINFDIAAAAVNDPASQMLLAERNGSLAACCQLETIDDYIYFGLFAVHPSLQGGGVGKEVLAEAERLAREEWRVAQMRMTVLTARADLIAWYVRRGYVRTGKLTPYSYGEKFGRPKQDNLEFELLVKTLVPRT